MSTTQTVTPLTEAQAIAQVEEWIAAGLPSGFLMALPGVKFPPGLVSIHAESREAVDLWAAALGVQTELLADEDGSEHGPLYQAVRCKPVVLGGWRLKVSVFMPKPMVAPFQIEVVQEHNQFTRPYRAQLQVVQQIPLEGTTYVRIPSRDNPCESIGFTQGCGGDFPAWLEDLPVGSRIYAKVNVGAVRDTDLVFTDWEQPS